MRCALLFVLAIPGFAHAQGQLTLSTSLDSSAAVTAPSTGPGGIDRDIVYLTARSGRGANVVPGSARYVSFPASAIDLRAGSFEGWFRANAAPSADRTTRTMFAVGVDGQSPLMVLEENDRLRFRVVTTRGTFESVAAANALVWPRWTWFHLRAEWNGGNTSDALRVYVDGTRVPMTTVGGNWSITPPASARLFVGARSTRGNDLADAIIDDVRAYSTFVASSPDAGVSPDATQPPPDAGSTSPDAGSTSPDAGSSSPDAGSVDSGTTQPPPSGSAPSAGCGPTNGARGVINGSIVVNGQARTYVLSVPSTYSPSVPLALTFGWHGTDWQASTYRASTDIETQANGASIFVYPQGAPNWDETANSRDMAFFDALYADLTSRYCVDLVRVYSFGRSRGAGFTNALGCHRASRFAAIAALMGWAPAGTCGGPAPAAFVYHNADDPTVEYSYGVASRDHWRAANGCTSATVVSTPSTCTRNTQCSAGGGLVEWCSQPTGGHYPHGWTGAAMWRFFQATR